MVSLFVSMLYRAFEKIRKLGTFINKKIFKFYFYNINLGAVRSHQHLMCIE